jgi:hypothetical protein
MTESGLAFGFMLFLLFLLGAVIGGWVMLFLLQRDMAELRAAINTLRDSFNRPANEAVTNRWVMANNDRPLADAVPAGSSLGFQPRKGTSYEVTTAGRIPHPHGTILAERVEAPPAPFVAVPDAVPPAPEERIAHEVSEEAIRGLTDALLRDAQAQGISLTPTLARENAREMLQTGDLGPSPL